LANLSEFLRLFINVDEKFINFLSTHSLDFFDCFVLYWTHYFYLQGGMFYKISLGQLIVLWLFGISFTYISLLSSDQYDSPFLTFSFVFTPFFLVFYTLGWRNARKGK
jgi:hypothetical protein